MEVLRWADGKVTGYKNKCIRTVLYIIMDYEQSILAKKR